MESAMNYVAVLFLSILLVSVTHAETTISGTVKTADGKVPAKADAHLVHAGLAFSRTFQSVPVHSDGSFTIEVEDEGVYSLMVTATNHQLILVPLVIDDETAGVISVDIRLQQLRYNRTPEKVKIVGDWNNFSLDSAEVMTKRPDGSFEYTLKNPAGEVHYQLVGLIRSPYDPELVLLRSVNAPGSDDYVYDGGGDYRSILRARDDQKITSITFSPASLPDVARNTTPKVTYHKNERLQALWDIQYITTKVSGDVRKEINELPVEEREERARELLAEIKQKLLELMDHEDRVIGEYAALSIVQLPLLAAILNDEEYNAVRRMLPAESRMWSFFPSYSGYFLTHLGQEGEITEENIMPLVDDNPDRYVQALAFCYLIANKYYTEGYESVAKYHERLVDDYGDMEDVEYVLRRLNRDKAIMPGKPLPAFTVALLNSDDSLSSESLHGRYYLLDFWATWCGPCVQEMESLHEAYKKYGGENFEIVSLSFDTRQEDLEKFRAKRWEMPWRHAFLSGMFAREMALRYEAQAIPKPILIGPDGTILAMESDLLRGKLEATLAKYLGGGTAER